MELQQTSSANYYKISDNFSLMKLFAEKKVKISLSSKQIIELRAFTLRDILTDDKLNIGLNIWTSDLKDMGQQLGIKFNSSFDLLQVIIFDLSRYYEYSNFYQSFVYGLNFLFYDKVEINTKTREIKINDTIMTPQIWDYVVYIVKLLYGEKVKQPLIFDSPETEAFFRKQEEMNKKIQKVKDKTRGEKAADKDGLLKLLLEITYAFPGLTFDYLLDQTLAQNHWLHVKAAGAVSYDLNAKIFAAGNMKKGKTPDFFIK